jgi:hypothetical protein
MAEIYTCICGGQRWTIFGPIIECDKCGKEYGLSWLDDEIETPKDFNDRIKKETKIKPERMDHVEIGPRIGKPIK